MLFGTEKSLFSSLQSLVDDYELAGIKCEFEAEGSRFEDVVRLRDICSKLGVDIYLKIGGAEAKRDVLDAIVLGVDGIIAPMIESDFAAYKFRKLVQEVYGDYGKGIKLAINIESKSAVEKRDAIISRLEGFLSHVTFGRTDLSGSYFYKNIVPDCDFILDIVQENAKKLKEKGYVIAMGGSISVKTISILKDRKDFCNCVDRIETRKCILPSKSMLSEGALAKCFEFERLYLLTLKERNEVFNKANFERLMKLEQRGV